MSTVHITIEAERAGVSDTDLETRIVYWLHEHADEDQEAINSNTGVSEGFFRFDGSDIHVTVDA